LPSLVKGKKEGVSQVWMVCERATSTRHNVTRDQHLSRWRRIFSIGLAAEDGVPPDTAPPVYVPDYSGDDDTADQMPAGTQLGSTPEAIARRQAARTARIQKGLLIIYTGQGKGKTTAALGTLLRAWGREMRVGGVQFFKHTNATFGELRALAKIQVELTPMGDGFTWTSRDLDTTQAKALHGWALAKQRIASGAFDVFLLDEFTYLLHFGWLETAEVLAWIAAHKPPMLHLIITGRDASRALIEAADLVTEMREVKHPLHTQGIRAQKGIEF
jgi:cob(I)alamin adenosyltransferase